MLQFSFLRSKPLISAVGMGLLLVAGCRSPSPGLNDYGGAGSSYPQPSALQNGGAAYEYSANKGQQPPQAAYSGGQRYPSVSRAGVVPQRGFDGASAFGAGPGGSGIVPH